MQHLSWRTWLSGIGLGITLALTLTLHSGSAACTPDFRSDFCSANYGIVGNLSPVAGRSETALQSVVLPLLPSAGALVYADYVKLEQEARALLQANLGFRQDLSPYQNASDGSYQNNFDRIVRQFDLAAGFDTLYTPPAGQGQPMTLQQRIDKADAELRRARDLYAVLAVYAPEARFRRDPAYGGSGLCGATNRENPDPPDPQHQGQVLPPVIDWCDFPARLRQAVREAANIRLIFAQEFMVDALGLYFSAGALVGGSVDQFVRDEIAKLRAAAYQYDLAAQGLTEVLSRSLGDGCYVADFFTQSEWALLSRTIEGKELAQHHIAMRRSYLDINAPDQVGQAQAAAQGEYRLGAVDGYTKLIGVAGTGAANPRPGCLKGTRPDSQVLANMVLNLMDTRRRAREMADGHNVFGFDIRYTPARPYRTQGSDPGLLDQARDKARLAYTIQRDTQEAQRAFDLNQQNLSASLRELFDRTDNDLQKEAGCDYQGLNYDTPGFISCVETMIKETLNCGPTGQTGSDGLPAWPDTFNTCMNRTTDGRPPDAEGTNLVVKISDMRTSMFNLRTTYLGAREAKGTVDNLKRRAEIEIDRNARVTSTIMTNGEDQAALDFVSTILDSFSIEVEASFPPGVTESYNPFQPVIATLVATKTIQQALADIDVENTNSAAQIKNLALDSAQAMLALQTALGQYQTQLADFEGVIGQTRHDLAEVQRQRAYVAANPANDPSYRLVRDSKRLTLAKQIEEASEYAYLAARRAEFEYAARLQASNFRISDIYKARTADEVLQFLDRLDSTVLSLPGAIRDADIRQAPLTISVAQHILNLDDPSTRALRFRQWVADHTTLQPDGQGVLKPVLTFEFNTSAGNGGILDRVQRTGYDFWWKHQMASMSVNLLTAQPDALQRRAARVSQAGQVELRNFAGCVFEYRLIPPALLLGLDYPSNQPTDVVSGSFDADVNGVHGPNAPGFFTPAFLSRPVASTTWKVVVYGGSPDGILPDMDLQQLTDIELRLNTTHASRDSNAPPRLTDCVRSDF